MNDLGFLRPIPEDASQVADNTSSLAMMAPASSSAGDNSSTDAIRAGRAQSEISDARADLPDSESSSQQQQQRDAPSPRRQCPERCKTSPKVAILIIVTTILVVVAVVLVAIFVSGDDDSIDLDDTTSSPTVDPQTIESFDAILETVSSPQDLNTPGTSQYQARQWLLTQDLLRDDVLLDGQERVIQRYVLANLYYATNGPFWNVLGYLQVDQSECEWTGLVCDADNPAQKLVVHLHLPSSNLTGSLPAELAKLVHLGELNLSQNQLSGNIPTNLLDDMKNLYYIDLAVNELTGPIPKRIWTLPALVFLYLNENLLSGSIERPTGSNTSMFLQEVEIDDNLLTGSLPSWWNEWTDLENWICWNNRLSGPLPSQLPPNIFYLDVSQNNLTSALPASYLNHSSLKSLYMNDNELIGGLPAGDEPSNLEQLWLKNNDFSGFIPTTFGNLWPNLKELLLYENDLTGNITLEKCQQSWPELERIETDCLTTRTIMAPVICECCKPNECY